MRTAISALIAAVPFTRLLSACRLTPSVHAASVTVNPSGSRQVLRSTAPGCTGLFMEREVVAIARVVSGSRPG